MIRLLVVSFAYPPYAEPGSIRLAGLCQYLAENEVETTVLTVKEKYYEGCDYSLPQPAGVPTVRTNVFHNPIDIYKGLRRLKSASPPDAAAAGENLRDKPRWRDQVIWALSIPDPKNGWYFPARRAGARLLARNRAEVLFSSGPPWTAHLVALHLKKAFGLPWIADYRDPWAQAPPIRPKPEWFQRVELSLENACVTHSDLVLCNTPRLQRRFEEVYPNFRNKFRTLTNGYLEAANTGGKRTTGRRLLLHIGSLYGSRRIDSFLNAVVSLVRAGRLDPNSFQIVFQGRINAQFAANAKELAPELLATECLQFRDHASWVETQELLWDADLLLLFQGSYEFQVPAKFYDYLRTGIPTFAVTEDGALTDIMAATQSGIWASPQDSEQIATKLLEAICLPRKSPEELEKVLGDSYHYRALSKQLSAWVYDLVPKSSIAEPR